MSDGRRRTSQPIWAPLMIIVLLIVAVVLIVDDPTDGNKLPTYSSTSAH